MDILAMSFCVKSSHSHLSVSLKSQHLLGFEEPERASAFMPPALTLNQSFQLCNLPVSWLHVLSRARRNPYCKIKDLNCSSTSRWLTDLEFSETKLEASALKLLCEGLKDPNCKLQKLKLSQPLKELFVFANALGDTGVQHLCEGLQHAKGIVKTLVHSSRLSECSLSAACRESLARVLSSTQSLTRLLLINNKIEDLGLKLLCEGLKQPDCQLKDLQLLKLNEYFLACNSVADEMMPAFSTLLPGRLWTCRLTGECCQDLCSALYTSEYLRDLDLSDNALGDEGMQVLCEGLKHPSCKPQTLWLAECRLTDACRGALASVLNRNENLTSLDLSGNDLKDFGVQMLYDALIQPICKLQTF
uniref:ribonuclease inhibitor-like n=1 Tax=Halichoerus grypus TaxID=9711 RepID=UPI0016591FFE|nr:ribonuclease inhibitor-like [Halichoerus grypus]